MTLYKAVAQKGSSICKSKNGFEFPSFCMARDQNGGPGAL